MDGVIAERKVNKMPFPPASRSRSTSAGSSEAHQHEDELGSARPRSGLLYPSLLDASLKGFQESGDEKGTRQKSPTGVLGLDVPVASQTRSCKSSLQNKQSPIGAPPGLEHLEHTELLTDAALPPPPPYPASIVEPPPGLQKKSPVAIGVDCGSGCQLFIPQVHSFVPPPPAHSPTLPIGLSDPEPNAVMDAPLVESSSFFPSIGSANHGLGVCKPCAFVHTKGCQSGVDCSFCHLCPPGEKKRRSKMSKEMAKISVGGVSANCW